MIKANKSLKIGKLGNKKHHYSGGDLLSQGKPPSIIGAEGLNC